LGNYRNQLAGAFNFFSTFNAISKGLDLSGQILDLTIKILFEFYDWLMKSIAQYKKVHIQSFPSYRIYREILIVILEMF